MTVRQCFSKAFGEVPIGATCHIFATLSEKFRSMNLAYSSGGFIRMSNCPGCRYWIEGEWKSVFHDCYDDIPDISDRPAEAYRGFFGKEYDAVLDEQPPIQFSGEVTGLRAVGDKTEVEILVDEPSEVVLSWKGKLFDCTEVVSE